MKKNMFFKTAIIATCFTLAAASFSFAGSTKQPVGNKCVARKIQELNGLGEYDTLKVPPIINQAFHCDGYDSAKHDPFLNNAAKDVDRRAANIKYTKMLKLKDYNDPTFLPLMIDCVGSLKQFYNHRIPVSVSDKLKEVEERLELGRPARDPKNKTNLVLVP